MVIALNEEANRESVRILADAAPKGTVVKGPTLREQLAISDHKTVLLVGHIESNVIVIRNALDQVVDALPLEEVEQIRRKLGMNVIVLGCESARDAVTSGFLQPVYTRELASALSRAFQQETMFGFLAALGTRDNPLIVRPPLIDGIHATYLLERAERAARSENAVAASVRGFVDVRAFVEVPKASSRLPWVVAGGVVVTTMWLAARKRKLAASGTA